MQFFKQLEKETLFFQEPKAFSKNSAKDQLAYCLGAALYMPATRDDIATQLLTNKFPNVMAVIIDLEDAVGEQFVETGIENVIIALKELQGCEQLPLIFVRPRHAEQFAELVTLLGDLQHVLTGYVFPKFEENNMISYLHILRNQRALGYALYGMPVLETGELLYKEQRIAHLMNIREQLIAHYDMILNVRVGTTDFAGLYGLRRTVDMSVYDLLLVRDCLGDLLNVFSRADYPFVLSGGVWEYFDTNACIDSPAMQGLIKEALLDRVNGFIGKTVIHPSHINVVNAIYAVTHEEYLDACTVCAHRTDDGVYRSDYANKMNEVKPHMLWAQKTLLRANVYGVLQPNKTFHDLL